MRKQVEESVAPGAAARRGRGGRFSAGRKRETVLRLLRGEDLESVSRALGITAARASQWRDQFLAAGQAGLLIDGVHVGGHCIVVALGIDKTGAKHPIGLWEGATENATVCQGLLTNLASRGLRTDRSLLVIVDGAKALDTAVTRRSAGAPWCNGVKSIKAGTSWSICPRRSGRG